MSDGGTRQLSGVQHCSNFFSGERVASRDAGLRHGQRHDESGRSGNEQVGATAAVADEGVVSLASLCGPHCQTPCPDAGSPRSQCEEGTVPEIDDVDTVRWLKRVIHGIQAASMGGLL